MLAPLVHRIILAFHCATDRSVIQIAGGVRLEKPALGLAGCGESPGFDGAAPVDGRGRLCGARGSRVEAHLREAGPVIELLARDFVGAVVCEVFARLLLQLWRVAALLIQFFHL